MNKTDDILNLYNTVILQGAAGVAEPRHLAAPHYTARASSPICGSSMTVEFSTDPDGRVVEFGYDAEACALGNYVLSVMKDAIVGCTREEIAAAGSMFEHLLAGEKTCFDNKWDALQNLSSMVHYKSRHNAMLLPFEAVEKAFKTHSKA